MKPKKLALKKGIRHLSWSEIGTLIKTAFIEFFKENSFFHGAALSYYTIFALVPMLYLSFETFGKIVGHDTMVQIASKLLKEQVGVKDISGIISFLNEMDLEKGSVILNISGIIALILSSTALLMSLRGSLNDFFDVEKVFLTKKKMILDTIVTRLISVSMLAVFGVIVIVLYFAQTILISVGNEFFTQTNAVSWIFMEFAQHGISILTNLLIFTLIFKYLHDGLVMWKLALGGALVTSIMLYFGQLLIKSYLANYFFAKDGGIAGTLMIILLWTYYSSQIIFLGAKFTAVYAKMVGKPIVVKR
ncbi:MAG: YihY/virulence factor BrkB family protein [Fluviicola sp.]|jgi:membrane protein|nr:YihY/virulence factor BrkB family protein [Fluviicola sp.]